MDDKRAQVSSKGLRCVASLLCTDNTDLVDKMIMEGLIEKVLNLSYSSSFSVIKESLWAWSNLVAGTPNHAAAFINSDLALNRALVLMNN